MIGAVLLSSSAVFLGIGVSSTLFSSDILVITELALLLPPPEDKVTFPLTNLFLGFGLNVLSVFCVFVVVNFETGKEGGLEDEDEDVSVEFSGCG